MHGFVNYICLYISELLPGIEEFLCTDLAEECLSDSAEEKRQYFIERLDILKLPPSIPPRRPGKWIYPYI